MRRFKIQFISFSAFFFLASSINIASAAETLSENERLLRAAFIYNFTKFTYWPDSAVTSKDSPLFICSIGEDKQVDSLKKLNNKRIKNHTVVIRSLQNEKYTNNCHVLYIAASANKQVNNITNTIRTRPVLTVSSISNFSHSGGMIEFFRENKKTRFKINLTAVTNAGLKISSRLLILAVIINNGTEK
ncbi:MAG: YfiR family protein [Gammaproteobacteria bacterium]|nr:YfiR family protein [Gammaproteobacteria bacterium]